LYNEYILIKGRNGGGKYVNYPDLIIAWYIWNHHIFTIKKRTIILCPLKPEINKPWFLWNKIMFEYKNVKK
jgi:hypothetical protein